MAHLNIHSWMLILCLYNATNILFAEECSEYYRQEESNDENRGSSAIIFVCVNITNPDVRVAIKYPLQFNPANQEESILNTDYEKKILDELQFMKYLEQASKDDDKDSDDTSSCSVRADNCNFIKLIGECTINGVTSIILEYLPTIFAKMIFPEYKYALMLAHALVPKFYMYAFHLTQAVETLYRKGIIHGDLTASNVGVNAEGVLKVFDFGNSYRMQTPKTSITCTVMYCAPEVLLIGEISDRSLSDTWSAGSIIYEMFTGERFMEHQWQIEYELCERAHSEGAWTMYSTCSARALYYTHRLNRCPKEDSECASAYRDIERKLEAECKPNYGCVSKIDTKYREQLAFAEKINVITNDEEGRIRRVNADKTDLIDLLDNMLRFNYAERIKPKEAMSHNFFKRFNSNVK